MTLTAQQLEATFAEMLRIRGFEERAQDLYAKLKFKGSTHLGFGQEAVAASRLAAEHGISAEWSHLSDPVPPLAGFGILVPFSPALEEKWQVQADDVVSAALRSLGRGKSR